MPAPAPHGTPGPPCVHAIHHHNGSFFLTNILLKNGFHTPPPSHKGAIIPRSGHVQRAVSEAGTCLWEPLYHGITLGWEASHHFLYTSQRDEMALTWAQRGSLRTPTRGTPTTAGNLARQSDLTSWSETTLFPNTCWRSSG